MAQRLEAIRFKKPFMMNQPDQKSEVLAVIKTIQNSLVTGYSADFAKHAGKTNAVHIEKIFQARPGHRFHGNKIQI